jgi:p-aminobenzoyl-glutamate transporter AbgT
MEKQLLPLNALSFNIQKDFVLCFVLMKRRDSYSLIIYPYAFPLLKHKEDYFLFIIVVSKFDRFASIKSLHCPCLPFSFSLEVSLVSLLSSCFLLSSPFGALF